MERYQRENRLHRSLSETGRRRFIVLMCLTITALASYAWAQGAWLVMPFAGAEIAVVLLAFRCLRAHDRDYESIVVDESGGSFESCSAGRVNRFRFNPSWAHLVCRSRGWRCDLALRSHGREVPIGKLLSDDQRLQWAKELGTRIKLVRSR